MRPSVCEIVKNPLHADTQLCCSLNRRKLKVETGGRLCGGALSRDQQAGGDPELSLYGLCYHNSNKETSVDSKLHDVLTSVAMVLHRVSPSMGPTLVR